MMEETDVSDADLLAAVDYLDPRKFEMLIEKLRKIISRIITINLLDSFWFICSH